MIVSAKGPIPLKFTHCTYCEKEFDANPLSTGGRFRTRDHFIPISKGGSSKESRKNLYVVCQHCNLIKGNLMPFEFIYSLSQAIKHKECRFRSNGFTYNAEAMRIVLKNVKKIWNSDDFINSRNQKTRVVTHVKQRNFSYDNRIGVHDGEFHVVIKKEKSNPFKADKNDGAGCSLSVNTNTPRQSKERIAYLQTQTIDQFQEKKRLEQFMKYYEAEPQLNFHEPE